MFLSDWLEIGLMVLLAVTSGVIIFNTNTRLDGCDYCKTIIEDMARNEGMMDKANYDGALANGLYWPSQDYYCVWTKDRKIDDINMTDQHEQCHDFVYKNYTHFCGDEKYGRQDS